MTDDSRNIRSCCSRYYMGSVEVLLIVDYVMSCYRYTNYGLCLTSGYSYQLPAQQTWDDITEEAQTTSRNLSYSTRVVFTLQFTQSISSSFTRSKFRIPNQIDNGWIRITRRSARYNVSANYHKPGLPATTTTYLVLNTNYMNNILFSAFKSLNVIKYLNV
jgi:hypothetical protein